MSRERVSSWKILRGRKWGWLQAIYESLASSDPEKRASAQEGIKKWEREYGEKLPEQDSRAHPSGRPGFLRSNGSRDTDGATARPDSVHGMPTRIRSWQNVPTEVRVGGAPLRPRSVNGIPMRNPVQGGGGHFGR